MLQVSRGVSGWQIPDQEEVLLVRPVTEPLPQDLSQQPEVS